jgi:hypothetical protein
MRQIRIIEVLDTRTNDFIPVKEAISRDLFNPTTFIFYDPVKKKEFSISEAAERGLFKSSIDMRPELLVIDRVKTAETVRLISATDPNEPGIQKYNIETAIKKGIVDTAMRIYRNPITNEVMSLKKAIQLGHVQVKTVRETKEKIKETLLESSSKRNDAVPIGIYKRTEKIKENLNHNQSDSEEDDRNESPSSSLSSLQLINGDYYFDIQRTENITKHKENTQTNGKDDQEDSIPIAIAHLKRPEKLIKKDENYSFKWDLNKLRPDPIYNSMFDFKRALKMNLIILPDSPKLITEVKYVIDLENNEKIDFDEACHRGIVDTKNRLFLNTLNNQTMPLFEALRLKYIRMRDDLVTNYGEESIENTSDSENDDADDDDDNNLSHRHLLTVFDPKIGQQIPINKVCFILNSKLSKKNK